MKVHSVKICNNIKILILSIKLLFRLHEKLILKPYKGVRNSSCGAKWHSLGQLNLNLKEKFYDYKAKYSKSANTKHIMPTNLNRSKYNEVMRIAKSSLCT